MVTAKYLFITYYRANCGNPFCDAKISFEPTKEEAVYKWNRRIYE